jgi:hypothetical protein
VVSVVRLLSNNKGILQAVIKCGEFGRRGVSHRKVQPPQPHPVCEHPVRAILLKMRIRWRGRHSPGTILPSGRL